MVVPGLGNPENEPVNVLLPIVGRTWVFAKSIIS